MKQPLDEEAAFLLIRTLIQQTGGIPFDRIGQHDSLINNLGMDSVELIDLLIQLEEYDVVIHESQLSSELTVEQLAHCLMGTQ